MVAGEKVTVMTDAAPLVPRRASLVPESRVDDRNRVVGTDEVV
jgi:hypothetical protein